MAVSAGAALVLAAGGFAFARSGEDRPIPWADQPVTRASSPLRAKPEPRSQQQPCEAKDLESLWPEGGSTFRDNAIGSDSTGLAVVIRNVGAKSCTLSGHPQVQGLDREGKQIGSAALPGTYLPSTGRNLTSTTIEPGEPAMVFLSIATRGCHDRVTEYRGAKLLLDNGFGFTIRNAWLRGSCRLKVSSWEHASNDAGQFWALEARIIAPPSAVAGTDFTYVVEMVNITDATVPLEPCMVYTQVLSPEDNFDLAELDTMLHYTHRLNCSVRSIGPRSAHRFEMKFPVPADFAAGKAVVHWFAEDSPRPFASSGLTVFAPVQK